MNPAQMVEQIVETSLQNGAQGAQAQVSLVDARAITIANDRLKSTGQDQRTRIQLKIIYEGRSGSSSTTTPEDVEGLVHRAIDAAKFGEPVSYPLPGRQPAPDVKIYDPEVLKISIPEMIDVGMSMVETTKTAFPAVVFHAGVECQEQHIEFANSAGARHAFDATQVDVYEWGQLIRGNDFFSTGSRVSSRKNQLDLALIERRVMDNLKYAEQTASIPNGKYPVIFTPEACIAFLMTLQVGLNGNQVLQGESPLTSRLAGKIADSRFSLVDDSLIDFAPRSAPFDEEGVPRKTIPLIENGELKNFLYDLDSASRAGKQSTGNGPGPLPGNWMIAPGQTPFEQLVLNLKQGLLVNSLMGLEQSNLMNGDFSFLVDEGYLVSKGEVRGQVKETTITGNVYELLNQIVEIGNTPEWVSNALQYCTPYLEVDRVNVTSTR